MNVFEPDVGTPEREARIQAQAQRIAAMGIVKDEDRACRSFRANARKRRTVIAPDGTDYPSVGRASVAKGLPSSTIWSWCDEEKNGWKFEGEAK